MPASQMLAKEFWLQIFHINKKKDTGLQKILTQKTELLTLDSQPHQLCDVLKMILHQKRWPSQCSSCSLLVVLETSQEGFRQRSVASVFTVNWGSLFCWEDWGTNCSPHFYQLLLKIQGVESVLKFCIIRLRLYIYKIYIDYFYVKLF